ncbi:hypothetical protein BJX63DRAFT_380197 [Aspergillus granulosus]|uniref:Secreted protein n=1 Tax=Aspergillus granulosus TaxID=176169 RepID=A0ABR4HZ28_9EURO
MGFGCGGGVTCLFIYVFLCGCWFAIELCCSRSNLFVNKFCWKSTSRAKMRLKSLCVELIAGRACMFCCGEHACLHHSYILQAYLATQRIQKMDGCLEGF